MYFCVCCSARPLSFQLEMKSGAKWKYALSSCTSPFTAEVQWMRYSTLSYSLSLSLSLDTLNARYTVRTYLGEIENARIFAGSRYIFFK